MWRFLKRIFLSEKKVMAAILVNALVIFFLSFPNLEENSILIQFDFFFIYFFILEAIIKLKAYGIRDYFKNKWNRFDFLILVLSLPTLLMGFFPIPDTSSLLILRLFRLIRLARFLKFVPHLTMILAGLKRAIRASFFVLIALFFLNFLLGIFTCHFLKDAAPEYFGDPLLSIYSIFQMFTLEGWNEIPKAIQLENSIMQGLMKFYFVIVVLIGGIFGMSLANAIFVDEMTMDNNKILEDKIDDLQSEITELKELIKNRNA